MFYVNLKLKRKRKNTYYLFSSLSCDIFPGRCRPFPLSLVCLDLNWAWVDDFISQAIGQNCGQYQIWPRHAWPYSAMGKWQRDHCWKLHESEKQVISRVTGFSAGNQPEAQTLRLVRCILGFSISFLLYLLDSLFPLVLSAWNLLLPTKF